MSHLLEGELSHRIEDVEKQRLADA
jgi:hypothetical protein